MAVDKKMSTHLSRRAAAMNLEHLVCLLVLLQAVEGSLDVRLVLVLQFLQPLVFQTLQHSTVITLDHHLLQEGRDGRVCANQDNSSLADIVVSAGKLAGRVLEGWR